MGMQCYYNTVLVSFTFSGYVSRKNICKGYDIESIYRYIYSAVYTRGASFT